MTDYFAKGVELFEKGALEEALCAFKSCDSLDARAKALSGAVLARLGRSAKAEAAFRKAIEMAPEEELIHVSYAAFLNGEKKTIDAERVGAAAAAIAARSGAAQRILDVAEGLYRCRVWRATAQAFEWAHQITPLRASSLRKAASAYARVGESEAALRALDAIAAIDEYDCETFQLGAQILGGLRDWARLERVSCEWATKYPDNLDALYCWSQALFELGRYPDAADIYERAVELKPENLLVLTTHGGLCLAARKLDRAEDVFQRAIALEPNNAEVMYGLAKLATYKGDLATARNLCRSALSINPQLIKAYGELSALTEGALDEDEIVQLETFSRAGNFSAEQRAIISFALGDAYRHRREFANAFTRYEQANSELTEAATKGESIYRHAKELKKFDAIKALFPIDASASLTPCDPVLQMKPIFIVGMPRSGTTLVESILAGHANVYGAGELHEMPVLFDECLLHAAADMKKPGRDEYYSWRERYLAAVPSDNNKEAVYFVDKQPMNFRAIGLIKQLFPDARIINMQRNPLDTCFSIYRRNFSKEWAFSNSLHDLGQFYALYAQYMVYWGKVFPGEILTVQYGDLVAEFENNVHRIVEYSGLGWDETCLKPEQVKRNVITFSSVQVRKRVTNAYSGQAEPFHKFLESLRRELLRANIDLESGALLSAPQ